MNETLLILVLVVAVLAVTTVLATFAVRAARRLSKWTISRAVVWRVVAAVVVVVALLVVAPLFGLTGTTTTESSVEPAPITGEFRATPLPKTPRMAEDETCWSAEAAVDSRNDVNLRQWRYAQLVEWCGNGSQILEVLASERSWDSLSPFWDFERYHDVSETEWDDRYFAYSQAKFKACIVLDSFCIVDNDPSLELTAYANGTFNVEYHGDWTADDDTTLVQRTSVWGAITAALAGLVGALPLSALLVLGGYVATRSKMEGLRSAGVGLMAGGMTLAGVLAMVAFLVA